MNLTLYATYLKGGGGAFVKVENYLDAIISDLVIIIPEFTKRGKRFWVPFKLPVETIPLATQVK